MVQPIHPRYLRGRADLRSPLSNGRARRSAHPLRSSAFKARHLPLWRGESAPTIHSSSPSSYLRRRAYPYVVASPTSDSYYKLTNANTVTFTPLGSTSPPPPPPTPPTLQVGQAPTTLRKHRHLNVSVHRSGDPAVCCDRQLY